MLENHQQRQTSLSRRYYSKSLASETQKVTLSVQNPLLNNRKRKTLFSKTMYQPKERVYTEAESVINGWESEVK